MAPENNYRKEGVGFIHLLYPPLPASGVEEAKWQPTNGTSKQQGGRVPVSYLPSTAALQAKRGPRQAGKLNAKPSLEF